MRIAILHVSYDRSLDPISGLDPVCDPSRYLPGHECHLFAIDKARAAQQVVAIAQQGFDVAINLCDGAWHGDTAGVEVVQALEGVNMAFTGAGSLLYDPSREGMKMASHAVGVPFPAYVMARTAADVTRAAVELGFPLLVKHPQGYSSVGLSPSSRVTDAEALAEQAALTMQRYGAALIEEFIDGREFTVLVAEARHSVEEAWALHPVEFRFPPAESFKHFDLKWRHFDQMTTHRVADAAVADRLRQAAARAFAGLGCEGYARCDFRMDAAGEVYLLEVNPNCAVFYPDGQFGSADFILAAQPGGHRAFVEHLIACALARRARRERPWEIRFTRSRGFGLYARRSIRAGEVVEAYEERAATLVSRGHAMQHWAGSRRRWFDQYAWPITHDTHVMWSADPDGWRPINHACDPSTWLQGLDVVARRNIPAGEEVTLDYATFCGPDMEPFECRCGAERCRHVVTGDDHLLPAVRDAYAGHVSDYVRSRQAHAAPQEGPPVRARRNQCGLCVVASRALPAGAVVARLAWGAVQPRPAVHTIQVAEDGHAEPRPFWLRYINHSCDPNVAFDLECLEVRTLRDIADGEELGVFYPSTEWEMCQPFECQCGAAGCLGRILGAAHIDPAVMARYALTGVVRRRSASANEG